MKLFDRKLAWLAFAFLSLIFSINILLSKLNKKAQNEISFYQAELFKLKESREVIEQLRSSRLELVERMRVFESIERSRVATIRILNLVIARWPQNAKLLKLDLSGNQVTLYLANISKNVLNNYCLSLKNDFVNCSIRTKQRKELSESLGTLVIYYDDELADFDSDESVIRGTGS